MVAFPNPIVNRLVIYGSDGLPDVTIGPSPVIRMYDGSAVIIQIGIFGSVSDPRLRINNADDTSAVELRVEPITDSASIELSTVNGNALLFMQDTSPTVSSLKLNVSVAAGGVFEVIARDTMPPVGDSIHEIVVVSPSLPVTAIKNNDPTEAFDFEKAEIWHNVTFQNGWANLPASPFAPVSVRALPFGYIAMRGVAVGGTKVNGTVITQLPGAYRNTTWRQQLAISTDVAGVTAVIQVEVGGIVKIYQMTGAANAISFDGLMWPYDRALG